MRGEKESFRMKECSINEALILKMRYDNNSTGPIDKDKFARSYAQRIMRDHIDGKSSEFLNSHFTLRAQPYRGANTKARELYVSDGTSGITLGGYLPRLVLQRHRFRVWLSPKEITDFFGLNFEDYLAFYNITDETTVILARLRWL
jgi:hypothetical protein